MGDLNIFYRKEFEDLNWVELTQDKVFENTVKNFGFHKSWDFLNRLKKGRTSIIGMVSYLCGWRNK
jgi:hypothetical protein